MTGNVARAFRQHPQFEQTGVGEYRTLENQFPGELTVIDSDGSAAREYRLTITTPTLDAVVEGETVAEVVADGWFETLERRLGDANDVAETDATPPIVERDGEEVVITVEFPDADPERVADDAVAVVEFVEGTWVQGIIPGYDYGEPAASLREQAMQNYQQEGAGGPGQSDGSRGPRP